jgi:hypothetical protein
MSIALAAASSVLGKRGAGEEDQGTKRQRTVNAPSAVVFVRGVAGGMSDADLFALWCAPLPHVAPLPLLRPSLTHPSRIYHYCTVP